MKTFGKGEIASNGCLTKIAKTRSFFKRQLHRWERRQGNDLVADAMSEAIALVAERSRELHMRNLRDKPVPAVIHLAPVFLMSDYVGKQSKKTRTVVVIRRSHGHKATYELLQVAA